MEELQPQPVLSMDELLEAAPEPVSLEDAQLKAVLEAMVYVTEEPLTVAQMAAVLQQPESRVRTALDELIAEFEKPEHGLAVREIAGGFQMATKPEHHEAVRNLVRSLKSPLKLSLPALETLAVIAYKQPVTVPEIGEIRGVDSSGVIATLLDRKLITTAGRKAVIGRPILYKTTKEFLLRFGLKDVNELPSMEEFEKLVAESFQSELIPVNESDAAAPDANDAEPPPEAGEHPESSEVEATSESDPAA